jgi:hypothetical protein
MPKVKGKENKAKLSKVYAICNGMQKRNHMSEDAKERCIMGIAKKWKILGNKKSKAKK